jgi:hypothetical protein
LITHISKGLKYRIHKLCLSKKTSESQEFRHKPQLSGAEAGGSRVQATQQDPASKKEKKVKKKDKNRKTLFLCHRNIDKRFEWEINKIR